MTRALNTARHLSFAMQQGNNDRLGGTSKDRSVLWASFGPTVAKHAVERPQPLAAIGLFCEPLCKQQVAQLPMRTDDAERDMARRQLLMEITQHARTRQIDVGGGGKIARHKLDFR